MRRFWNLLAHGRLVIGLAALALFAVPAIAGASTAISQGYSTNETGIVAGSLVSLTSQGSSEVVLATPEKAGELLGVVSERPLLEVSGGVGSVQVATQGAAYALVSDLNGQIRTGDRITASPIAGVGMRMTGNGTMVGSARADFASFQGEEHTITDTSGREHAVKIANIPVQVRVTEYTKSTVTAPQPLQEAADTIAGRNVAAIRVLIAAGLALLLLVVVGILIYAAIHTSILSFGRNPMAQKALRKSVRQVLLTAFLVTFIGFVAIFAVLRL